VTFNASSCYDPDGYIVSYRWDFDDGNITIAAVPVVNHTYREPGTYDVTLTVTDNDGLNRSVENSLTIKEFIGDINNDGSVDIIDLTIAGLAFNSELGDARWNEAADVDRNGVIDIVDIVIIAREFGFGNTH
jgi:PKD repeat protein